MVATLPPVEDHRPPPAVLRIVNPVMRMLLRSSLHRTVSKDLMLLFVQGRKTRRIIPVVVGRHMVDGTLLVSASGNWRHNLRGGAPVQVVLHGVEHTAHAELEEDPDEVARMYRQLLEIVGLDKASTLGLRVNVRRLPSAEELKPAVAQRAIARVRLDADLQPPRERPTDQEATQDSLRGLTPPPTSLRMPHTSRRLARRKYSEGVRRWGRHRPRGG